jgi:hypothetical protein
MTYMSVVIWKRIQPVTVVSRINTYVLKQHKLINYLSNYHMR